MSNYDETKELTYEQIESAVQLTPDQLKAVKALIRSIKKCEKLKLEFYTVLESMQFLNGNHIYKIIGDEDRRTHGQITENTNVNDMGCNSHFNTGFAGWADDPHYVILNEKGLKYAKEVPDVLS